MRGGIETLPRHILYGILCTGRLDAVDLVSLEASSHLFRAPIGVPPYPFQSLTESAAHHLCRIHTLFDNFPARARSALLLRCGRNWKLVLHFLQCVLQSSRRTSAGNNVLVAAGMSHTVMVNGEGDLYICALRDPTYTRISLPGTGRPIVHISASESSGHVALVTDVGQVYTFTRHNSYLQDLTPGEPVISMPKLVSTYQSIPFNKVACGKGFTLAITRAGEVFSWGRNSKGQLGHGNRQDMFTPVRIEHFNESNPVAQVSAGRSHALAVTKSGQLFSWGRGLHYQLGHGDELDLPQPKQIEDGGFDDLFITSVSAGYFHSAAIDSSGHVYTWGECASGGLGHGLGHSQCSPRVVSRLEHFRAVQVEAGSGRTLVLIDNGVVHSFGCLDKFSLGGQSHVGFHDVLAAEPLELEGHKVAAISAGFQHTVVVTKKNAFFGFGCHEICVQSRGWGLVDI